MNASKIIIFKVSLKQCLKVCAVYLLKVSYINSYFRCEHRVLGNISQKHDKSFIHCTLRIVSVSLEYIVFLKSADLHVILCSGSTNKHGV